MERSCFIADLGGTALFSLVFPAPGLLGAVSAAVLGDLSFGAVDLGLGMKHSGFTPRGAAQEEQLLPGHGGFPRLISRDVLMSGRWLCHACFVFHFFVFLALIAASGWCLTHP